MNYQIKEKIIYSESYLLHFGEREIFGDIINDCFPDYSGISIGSVLYQSANKKEVYGLKKHLEIKRIRTIDEAIIGFFDDNEFAVKFYSSNNFSKLQEMYLKEFDLNLIRKIDMEHMEVEGRGFYIPPQASNPQILVIQKLLNLYFFTIEQIDPADISNNQGIDWGKRLSILYQEKII